MFNSFHKLINVPQMFNSIHDDCYQNTIEMFLLYTTDSTFINWVKAWYNPLFVLCLLKKTRDYHHHHHNQSRRACSITFTITHPPLTPPHMNIVRSAANVRKSGNDVPKRIRFGASSGVQIFDFQFRFVLSSIFSSSLYIYLTLRTCEKHVECDRPTPV